MRSSPPSMEAFLLVLFLAGFPRQDGGSMRESGLSPLLYRRGNRGSERRYSRPRSQG